MMERLVPPVGNYKSFSSDRSMDERARVELIINPSSRIGINNIFSTGYSFRNHSFCFLFDPSSYSPYISDAASPSHVSWAPFEFLLYIFLFAPALSPLKPVNSSLKEISWSRLEFVGCAAAVYAGKGRESREDVRIEHVLYTGNHQGNGACMKNELFLCATLKSRMYKAYIPS